MWLTRWDTKAETNCQPDPVVTVGMPVHLLVGELDVQNSKPPSPTEEMDLEMIDIDGGCQAEVCKYTRQMP